MRQGTDYTVGKWAGKPNYKCTRCSFANPSLSELRRHIRAVHGLPQKATVRTEPSTLLGPDGRPMELKITEPSREIDEHG